MALGGARTQRARAQGWEEGVETENDDKTCEGEGRREKGRWISQPSVKTHKRIIQCSSSSSSSPGGGCLLFLDVCLAASTGLALLPKGFPSRSHGQQTRRTRGWSVRRRAARPVRRSCSRPGLLALESLRRPSKGIARDYWHYNFILFFFFLKNPSNSSICLQRKCRCSDVGCCCWPTGRPAPEAVQGCSVSCIYIYIYIYLYIYIYALPFPVSHQ